MGLAEKIRDGRDRLGMTQAELAQKLGLTYSAVSQWEKGRAVPRMKVLHQLADLFDVPVSELLGEGSGNVVASSKLVPLLGYTHMGEEVDEDTCDRMVEVPVSVVEAHPNGYCVHADGDCMDNRYPDDSVLMVDPDMQPYNGCAVLAEMEGYRSVVRCYSRGSSTLMLAADSHSGEYDDIVVQADDAPVMLKGVVVWYQAEKDVRSH